MKAVKNLGMVDAQLLADYILQKYGPMSHLKLQKLLYYCEGYHLAYFDTSLIPQDFQAWVHGPVCREVYNNLKNFSLLYVDLAFDGQSNPALLIGSALSSEQQELLSDVFSELASWTGMQLENATHKELPWREARRGFGPADKCDQLISKETMKSFYKAELNVEA
ncbi:MAG: DUF4065 domain-containing protein [Cytophagaceae bacterium]|nr:MAG: DUF4065 domain-containing protein [Cytophagaceae bacterium]